MNEARGGISCPEHLSPPLCPVQTHRLRKGGLNIYGLLPWRGFIHSIRRTKKRSQRESNWKSYEALKPLCQFSECFGHVRYGPQWLLRRWWRRRGQAEEDRKPRKNRITEHKPSLVRRGTANYEKQVFLFSFQVKTAVDQWPHDDDWMPLTTVKTTPSAFIWPSLILNISHNKRRAQQNDESAPPLLQTTLANVLVECPFKPAITLSDRPADDSPQRHYHQMNYGGYQRNMKSADSRFSETVAFSPDANWAKADTSDRQVDTLHRSMTLYFFFHFGGLATDEMHSITAVNWATVASDMIETTPWPFSGSFDSSNKSTQNVEKYLARHSIVASRKRFWSLRLHFGNYEHACSNVCGLYGNLVSADSNQIPSMAARLCHIVDTLPLDVEHTISVSQATCTYNEYREGIGIVTISRSSSRSESISLALTKMGRGWHLTLLFIMIINTRRGPTEK